ncbi:MAG TPA: hypothetical protein VGC26_06140 [Afipia sp.]
MFLSFMAAALAGILISQGARVWVLFVIVLGAMLAALAAGWSARASIGEATGHAVMIGIAIQVGYALGLFGRLAFRSLFTIASDPIDASFYSGRGSDQEDIARR